MKIIQWFMTTIVAALVLLSLYTWKVSQPIFDEHLDRQSPLQELEIVPIEGALPSPDY
jgi:hypothetical protein